MSIRTAWNRIVAEREWLPAALLLLLGAALRFYALGLLPAGLNQDEASAGYDAWALLRYGVDRCGNAYPVLLEAWGSGQNVLYSYLAMPFIALLGLSELSVRLPAALVGTGTLAVFWLLARRLRGRKFGLCALFFLALNPWHIMAGRWALESNLLPGFLLAGMYFTARAREREWSLLPAAVLFALSLYTYGTAFLFLPVFLVGAVLWLRKSLRPKSFFVSFAAFVLLALPIAGCQVLNLIGEGPARFLGLTLPRLTETRQMATTVLGGGGLRAMGENFAALWRILIRQTDGLVFNSLGRGGMFYVFGLPLIGLGLIVSLFTRKDAPGEVVVRLAVLSGVLGAFLVEGNINRLNMLWLPLVYLEALGAYTILCKLKAWSVLPLAAVALCCALFWNQYNKTLGGQGSELFYPGLGEAIRYVQEQQPDSVYITTYVNQPYIFALFYTQTDPNEFIHSVYYRNPEGAFRAVGSFGGFRFGPAADAMGEFWILHWSEAGERPAEARFGSYVVCRGE